MKINFIDLQAQYKEYKKEIDSEVLEVMSLAQFIGGEKLNLFEKNLAAYTGSKHAIGCSSGTDALLLSLMALDISAGDEVITSPFTFISTAEVIALLGAKAIMPVSLYGQCADMEAINDIAKKHNLSVIEDACQSFGATYYDKKSCNLSTIGCTSFFPSKPLGAYGDGGAIFTNDDALAAKMRMLLNHGQNERYKHKYIGINGRLDAIQAAVLNVKLKHFDKEVRLRDEIGSRYSDLLEDSDVITPKIAPNATSVYAQYSIRVKDREAMIEKLNKKEIPTAVHYPVPLHMQEAFKYLDYKEGDFPISELVSKQIMSLPMSAYLSEAEQDFVVQAIKG